MDPNTQCFAQPEGCWTQSGTSPSGSIMHCRRLTESEGTTETPDVHVKHKQLGRSAPPLVLCICSWGAFYNSVLASLPCVLFNTVVLDS